MMESAFAFDLFAFVALSVVSVVTWGVFGRIDPTGKYGQLNRSLPVFAEGVVYGVAFATGVPVLTGLLALGVAVVVGYYDTRWGRVD